jgi:ATP-dependent RNA helicase DDX19/DBP5
MNAPRVDADAKTETAEPPQLDLISTSTVVRRAQDVLTIASETRFDDPKLGIHPNILKAISEPPLSWTTASQIQLSALPIILGKKDLVAQAKNGSGKTGAFGIGMIQTALDGGQDKPFQCLCLANAGEVASNIFQVLLGLNKYNPDLHIALATKDRKVGDPSSAAIVVGTCGTITNMLKDRRRNVFRKENLRVLVLDEADVMVGADGQLANVRSAIDLLKKGNTNNFQRILFSATYKDEVWKYATEEFAPRAETVQMQTCKKDIVLDTVKHCYVQCNGSKEKETFICSLFNAAAMTQCIIYCNYKKNADSLASKLKEDGFDCDVLHSGSGERRPDIMKRFEDAKFKVLITTDMIARGVDITKINMVINYDVPVRNGQVRGEDYIHRLGRCARYGRYGLAVNLLADQQDLKFQQQLEKYWEDAFKVELLDVTVSNLTDEKAKEDEEQRMEELLEKFLTMGNK